MICSPGVHTETPCLRQLTCSSFAIDQQFSPAPRAPAAPHEAVQPMARGPAYRARHGKRPSGASPLRRAGAVCITRIIDEAGRFSN